MDTLTPGTNSWWKSKIGRPRQASGWVSGAKPDPFPQKLIPFVIAKVKINRKKPPSKSMEAETFCQQK